MLSEKQNKIICIIMFFSLLFGIVCFFMITRVNILGMKDKNINYDYMYKKYLLKNDFDYFNGIYLNGFMVFMVFFIILLKENGIIIKEKEGN